MTVISESGTATAAPAAAAANLSHHRIMLDSVNWQAILAAVKAGKTFRGLPISLVAGYLDGPVSQWPAVAWGALQQAGIPLRSLVGITVTGKGGQAGRARVADSEPGDMNPASAAAWASGERAAGRWPVIYCSRSDKPHVIAACKARGLLPSHDYGLWIATLDGSFADLDGSDLRDQRGVVAVQYLGAAAAGGEYDVSLVVSSAWRAAKPSAPAPAPSVPGWKAIALEEAGVLEAMTARLAHRAKSLTELIKAHQ
jgi:hypothetical protein